MMNARNIEGEGWDEVNEGTNDSTHQPTHKGIGTVSAFHSQRAGLPANMPAVGPEEAALPNC